jgi:hypothetical protein
MCQYELYINENGHEEIIKEIKRKVPRDCLRELSSYEPQAKKTYKARM